MPVWPVLSELLALERDVSQPADRSVELPQGLAEGVGYNAQSEQNRCIITNIRLANS